MVLTCGIIGCGEITSIARADQLHEASNVEIRMAMDVNKWAAEDIADRYNVPSTTEEEDVFSNPKIDFVYIATPNHLHAPQTIQAAKAGKHIVVEKPMATNVQDAKRMVDICSENNVRLSVPLDRFTAGATQAKKLIDDNLIGTLVGTRLVRLGRKPESYWSGGYTGRIDTEWRQLEEQAGGGVLLMNNIHDIDRLRYITGLEADRVYAEADTFVTDAEVEDFISATIRYKGGAIGNIESSSFIEAGFDGGPYNRIYGDKGTIVLSDPLRVRTLKNTELGEPRTWHEVPTEPLEINFFEEFAEAVLDEKEVPISADDAQKDLEIVLAAYKSAETSSPVSLPL